MIPRQETVSNGIEWWLRPCGRLCHSLSVMSSVMARLQRHLMTQKGPPPLVCGHPPLYTVSFSSLAEDLHNYYAVYKHAIFINQWRSAIDCMSFFFYHFFLSIFCPTVRLYQDLKQGYWCEINSFDRSPLRERKTKSNLAKRSVMKMHLSIHCVYNVSYWTVERAEVTTFPMYCRKEGDTNIRLIQFELCH